VSAETWREVLEFPVDFKPTLIQLAARLQACLRETANAEQRERLKDAHAAAKKELGL
jgi:hypothetical protein